MQIDDILCPLCSSLLKEKNIKNKVFTICSDKTCYYKQESEKIILQKKDDIYYKNDLETDEE